jgi:hypothetical protein
VSKCNLFFDYPKSGKKHRNTNPKSESNRNIEFEQKLKRYDPT